MTEIVSSPRFARSSVYLVAAATSLYALGYLQAEPGSVARLGAAYSGFLAAMVLVVLADRVFAFLFAWEAMSLLRTESVEAWSVLLDRDARSQPRAG